MWHYVTLFSTLCLLSITTDSKVAFCLMYGRLTGFFSFGTAGLNVMETRDHMEKSWKRNGNLGSMQVQVSVSRVNVRDAAELTPHQKTGLSYYGHHATQEKILKGCEKAMQQHHYPLWCCFICWFEKQGASRIRMESVPDLRFAITIPSLAKSRKQGRNCQTFQ